MTQAELLAGVCQDLRLPHGTTQADVDGPVQRPDASYNSLDFADVTCKLLEEYCKDSDLPAILDLFCTAQGYRGQAHIEKMQEFQAALARDMAQFFYNHGIEL